MSRVIIKSSDGEAEIIKSTGEKKRMHAIDAMGRVKAGTHVAEYAEIQVGDRKENILVAIREKSAADLKKEKAARNKAIAKLEKEQAEADKKILEKESKAVVKTAEDTPSARTSRTRAKK